MNTEEYEDTARQMDADVVVIGGGVAGLSAATAAAWSGKRVVLVERSAVLGGTARQANGSIWIPNNHLAKAKGIQHDLDDEMRFILSECWPAFSEGSDYHGVGQHAYTRLETYLASGEKVIRDLDRSGVQKFTQLDQIFKSFFFSKADSKAIARDALEHKNRPDAPHDIRLAARQSWDYCWNNPYNRVPYGKHVWAAFDRRITGQYFRTGLKKHGRHIFRNLRSLGSLSSVGDQLKKLPTKFWGMGHGLILVERFRRHLEGAGVQILLEHECVAVETSDERADAVLLKSTKTSSTIQCRVNDAVIFSNGCMSQLTVEQEEGPYKPVRSTCVAPTSTGDTFRIFDDMDVSLDRAHKPLLAQSIFQLAQQGKGLSNEPVFFIYGDSFFIVDRHGRRVVNEKLNYHDRASCQLGDPDREFLFLIGDRRFVDRAWGFGIGLPFDRSLVLEGDSFAELQQKADALFEREGVDFRLSDDFAETAGQTLDVFNGYAAKGHDPDFGRGENAYDVLGYPRPDRDHSSPSRTMQPLTGERLYLCVYSLSAFTTHGGISCDKDSLVLNRDGQPWRNLYAVGTCAASFLNGHYPAHGLSIGSCLVQGYLAGLHATGNEERLHLAD